jgi:hypothetical protein
VAEKYGKTLRQVQDEYSMALISLISHVSVLKGEDENDRMDRDRKDRERHGGKPKRVLNSNNEQAAAMILAGILG